MKQTADLISCTEVLDNDKLSLLEQVAYVARVSNPSNQDSLESSDRLVNYLMKHKHWSPFEMVNLTLELNTFRDIGRQALRHRSFCFQEYSQRYANPFSDLEVVSYREGRLQDETNRQNSIELPDTEEGQRLQRLWEASQQRTIDFTQKEYQYCLDIGLAKECARAHLPEGLTMSRLYMQGNLRSWIHYCQVRLDPTTQKEHRELAKACQEAIAEVFPLINEII